MSTSVKKQFLKMLRERLEEVKNASKMLNNLHKRDQFVAGQIVAIELLIDKIKKGEIS